MEGYVYIMSNESYKDGIYKIGFTKNHPEQRAQELYQATGVPTEFKVEFFTPCTDMTMCENIIHSWLYRYRMNGKREFFEIDIDRAIDLLIRAAEYQATIGTNQMLKRMLDNEDDVCLTEGEVQMESEDEEFDSNEKPELTISGLVCMNDVDATGRDAEIIQMYRNGETVSAIRKKVYGQSGGKYIELIRGVLYRYGVA